MVENCEKLNNQALNLASQGNYEDAIACLKHAISLENYNELLWFNLSLTYRDAGDMENAIQTMRYVLKINPYNVEALETMALYCYSMNHFSQAISLCDSGLEIDANNPSLWNTKGVVLFNKSDYKNAAECFEKACVLNPCYYDALFNLRDTYSELGNKIGVSECQRKMNQISRNPK